MDILANVGDRGGIGEDSLLDVDRFEEVLDGAVLRRVSGITGRARPVIHGHSCLRPFRYGLAGIGAIVDVRLAQAGTTRHGRHPSVALNALKIVGALPIVGARALTLVVQITRRAAEFQLLGIDGDDGHGECKHHQPAKYRMRGKECARRTIHA
jgi:hypothetical protein